MSPQGRFLQLVKNFMGEWPDVNFQNVEGTLRLELDTPRVVDALKTASRYVPYQKDLSKFLHTLQPAIDLLNSPELTSSIDSNLADDTLNHHAKNSPILRDITGQSIEFLSTQLSDIILNWQQDPI